MLLLRASGRFILVYKDMYLANHSLLSVILSAVLKSAFVVVMVVFLLVRDDVVRVYRLYLSMQHPPVISHVHPEQETNIAGPERSGSGGR
ncbi:hypothetical protein ACX9P6_004703 [Citrobacter braakii]